MNLMEVVNQAAALPNDAERVAFFETVFAKQPELRPQLEQLLGYLIQVKLTNHENVAQQPPTLPEGSATSDYAPKVGIGSVIAGKYKIREKLGEGGMGTVYIVDTIRDVKTSFALKLIKSEYASHQVIARFEQERQALALMNHPNIAKFIDAGTSESGQPYFVMEHIKGLSITTFCDQEKLTVEERLTLFQSVCHAVQHAHMKGIIHRDLKPGNILVTYIDGKPVPKVIDFGVAKATLQPLTDKTIHSEINSIIGTLEYMAPEQAEVNSLDIDTRADIYALGVILYELLTGALPFSRKELVGVALLRMLEIIRLEEPAKPSTKLSNSGSLPSIAATRKIDPALLMKKLRGEIDWIIMKCLEKERGRRYIGPNELAKDIDNYLHDLPLIASPPSKSYRLKKFLRRHQGKVIAASVLVLSLVGGVAGTTWGMMKAVKAEGVAKREAATAKAINDFLAIGILKQADPGEQVESGLLVDKDIKLRDAVIRAGKLLMEDKLNDQPRVKAALHQTIGNTLLTLGDLEKAKSHLVKAEALEVVETGANSLQHCQCRLDVARAQLEFADYPAAEKLIQETLPALLKHVPAHDPMVIRANRLLAIAYHQLHKYEEYRQLCQQNLATCEKALGANHKETVLSQAELARACGLVAIKHQDKKLITEAEPIYENAESNLKRVLGVQHPDYLDLLNSYAVFSSQKGDLPRAEKTYQQLIQYYAAVIDADHNSLLVTKQNLATVYFKQKRFDDALTLLKSVDAAYLKRYGPEYDGALAAKAGMAGIYLTQGQFAKAETMYRECLAINEKNKGNRDHNSNRYANQLAETLYRQSKFDEAEKYFARVLETNSLVSSTSEINLYENRLNLLKVRQKLSKHQECMELFEKNLASSQYPKMPVIRRAVLHLMYAESMLAIGDKDKASQQLKTSEELFEQDKKAQPQEYAPGKDRTKLLEQLENLRRKLLGK